MFRMQHFGLYSLFIHASLRFPCSIALAIAGAPFKDLCNAHFSDLVDFVVFDDSSLACFVLCQVTIKVGFPGARAFFRFDLQCYIVPSQCMLGIPQPARPGGL